MTTDRADHMVESLVVEIELLGDEGCTARDIILGLLCAAVEVAESNGVPADFVVRMARNVASYAGGPRYDA
jgi:hypothetical protein